MLSPPYCQRDLEEDSSDPAALRGWGRIDYVTFISSANTNAGYERCVHNQTLKASNTARCSLETLSPPLYVCTSPVWQLLNTVRRQDEGL